MAGSESRKRNGEYTPMAAAISKDAKTTNAQTELLEFVAKCECCGLTEECTPEYISRVRERYAGRWICGLCSEAVNDETSRSKRGVVSTDEALKRHMKFYQQFKSCTPPKNSTEDLILAMKNLFQRSLDSPRRKRGSVSVYPSASRSSSSPLVQ